MNQSNPSIDNISPGTSVLNGNIGGDPLAPQRIGTGRSNTSLPGPTIHNTPVAVAVDFMTDGSTLVHSTYDYPKSVDGSLLFKCAPQPDSIRVIVHETENVHVGENGCELPRACLCAHYPNQDSQVCAICTFREIKYPTQKNSTSPSSQHAASVNSLSDTGGPLNEAGQRYRGLHGLGSLVAFDHESRSSCLTCEARAWGRTWKAHGSAAGLDQADLHDFWYHGGYLDLGTNVILEDVSTMEAHTWNSVAALDGHVLYLGGMMYPVYILPSCINLHRGSGRYIQVECRFFRIQTKYGSHEYNICADLRETFWLRLNALSSAPRLFDKDLQMGAFLITLELLAAQEDVFFDFLRVVRANIPRSIANFDEGSNNAFLSDKQHVGGYRRAVRDMVQAVRLTVDTIMRASSSNDKLKAVLEDTMAQQKAIEADLSNFISDIEEDIERMIHRSEKDVGQRRDATLKRLTLVASIFLPLTFACSILSMGTRVRDLGPLWWDWLGICIITAFILVTGYHLSRAWDNIENAGRSEAFKRWPARLYWNKAKRDVLHRTSSRVRQRDALFPPVVGVSWFLSKMGFCIAACGAFLFGMFDEDLKQPASILGYSIAGMFVFFFAWIAFSKLVTKAISRLRSRRRSSGTSDNASMTTTDGASLDTNAEFRQYVRGAQWVMFPVYVLVAFIRKLESARLWKSPHFTTAADVDRWYYKPAGWLLITALMVVDFFFGDLYFKTVTRFAQIIHLDPLL